MKNKKTQDAQLLESAGELTGKQAAVLSSLVSGATIEAAAKANKTNPATVHGWLKQDDFRQAYRDALADVIGHSTGQLKAACAIAVDTLREVAQDVAAPSAPRVSAARAIIELSQKAIEIEDYGERIERLEELQK